MTQINSIALAKELASLRRDIDGLAGSLKTEQGEDAEVTIRAEELSAAIQRLEWAVVRRQSEAVVHSA